MTNLSQNVWKSHLPRIKHLGPSDNESFCSLRLIQICNNVAALVHLVASQHRHNKGGNLRCHRSASMIPMKMKQKKWAPPPKLPKNIQKLLRPSRNVVLSTSLRKHKVVSLSLWPACSLSQLQVNLSSSCGSNAFHPQRVDFYRSSACILIGTSSSRKWHHSSISGKRQGTVSACISWPGKLIPAGCLF